MIGLRPRHKSVSEGRVDGSVGAAGPTNGVLLLFQRGQQGAVACRRTNFVKPAVDLRQASTVVLAHRASTTCVLLPPLATVVPAHSGAAPRSASSHALRLQHAAHVHRIAPISST